MYEKKNEKTTGKALKSHAARKRKKASKPRCWGVVETTNGNFIAGTLPIFREIVIVLKNGKMLKRKEIEDRFLAKLLLRKSDFRCMYLCSRREVVRRIQAGNFTDEAEKILIWMKRNEER